jgi:hypothetical protein
MDDYVHEQYLLMMIEKMLPSVQQELNQLDYHHFRYGWDDDQVDDRLEELETLIDDVKDLIKPQQ